MKKIMNGGTAVLVGGLLFIVFIFLLMFHFMNQQLSLVTKDYYKDELAFSARQEAIRNTRGYDSLWTFTHIKDQVEIGIPLSLNNKVKSGRIEFYCPSNSNNDVKYSLIPNIEGRYLFDNPLHNRSFILKIYLSDGLNDFYKEIKI